MECEQRQNTASLPGTQTPGIRSCCSDEAELIVGEIVCCEFANISDLILGLSSNGLGSHDQSGMENGAKVGTILWSRAECCRQRLTIRPGDRGIRALNAICNGQNGLSIGGRIVERICIFDSSGTPASLLFFCVDFVMQSTLQCELPVKVVDLIAVGNNFTAKAQPFRTRSRRFFQS